MSLVIEGCTSEAHWINGSWWHVIWQILFDASGSLAFIDIKFSAVSRKLGLHGCFSEVLQCGKPNKPTMIDALNRPYTSHLWSWLGNLEMVGFPHWLLHFETCSRPLSSPDPRGGRTVRHCWRDGVATARRKSRTRLKPIKSDLLRNDGPYQR